jgi:hypothetical protein
MRPGHRAGAVTLPVLDCIRQQVVTPLLGQRARDGEIHGCLLGCDLVV